MIAAHRGFARRYRRRRHPVVGGSRFSPAVRLFGLTLAGALSLYFVIWWTALFAVLPFGMRSQHEDGPVTPGTEPGAPALPRPAREGDVDDASGRGGARRDRPCCCR